LTTKIAALVDGLGNLVRFVLLPGQRHDIKSVDDLLAGIACGVSLLFNRSKMIPVAAVPLWRIQF